MTRNYADHSTHDEDDWKVTVASTGEQTTTGGRIGIAESRYLGRAEHFAVTYGDGLTDANLQLPSRATGERKSVWYQLALAFRRARGLPRISEKPKQGPSWINGRYFFFRWVPHELAFQPSRPRAGERAPHRPCPGRRLARMASHRSAS
ncbi:hypothetical protein CQ13_38355 [Bradyrhizobium retamae]|uniref:Uncharacterized protein n=1 Tax=Bradyrhizobium retamae TaxID=1300035 RepID=A0A0R3NBX5_9BRAD|nr:hypothetical protein CQ13_38355 [Bradyrhizobium retamae]